MKEKMFDMDGNKYEQEISPPDVKEVDNINRPPHYTSHPSGVECIEIVEHFPYNIGAAMKYLWRSAMKGQTEDLQKARWHINRELGRMKKFDEEPMQRVVDTLKHCDCFEDFSVRQFDEVGLDQHAEEEARKVEWYGPPDEPSENVATINLKIEEFRRRQRERAEAEDKFGEEE